MAYIVSDEAEADLEEIGDYSAQDYPEHADTFIEEIRARCACVHGQYVIFYYVTETVQIARVLHGARNITRLFQP